MVTGLPKRHLTTAILFHDTLQRFRLGQGTGKNYLEAKLIQHLTSMREAVLYDIFLDLRKVYGTLDRER